MIKVRLANTFEIDNRKMQKWCYKRGITLKFGKDYLRDKMLEGCNDYLKKQMEGLK